METVAAVACGSGHFAAVAFISCDIARIFPCKVVINEAIEIAKKYSTEQSPRFINGVLDAVLEDTQSPDRTCIDCPWKAW